MKKNATSVKATTMVSLITALCLLGDSMLYVVLPLYWQEFGLDALWQVGVLLSVNRFARLPLNPLVVWLYAHIGRRDCIVIAILFAFSTTLAYSFPVGFWPLIAVRILWGFSWAVFRLGAYFSVLEFASLADRGHHMGVYNGVFRLGSLFGMLGGALIAEFIGPLAIGKIFAGACLLALPLAFGNIPVSVFKLEKQSLSDSVKVMFSEKLITVLILTSFLCSMVYEGIFISMLSYLIGHNQIRFGFMAALGFGAVSLSGFLQTLRWLCEFYLAPKIGRLSDGGLGRVWLLKNFCIVAAFLFFLVSYRMDIYWWLVVVMLIQMAGTGIITTTDAVAIDVASAYKNAPAILGAHSFCIDLGSALGPMVGYFLNERWNIHAPFFAAGIFLILVFAIWSDTKTVQVR